MPPSIAAKAVLCAGAGAVFACLCGALGRPGSHPSPAVAAPGVATAGKVSSAPARPAYPVFGDGCSPAPVSVCPSARESGYRQIAALQGSGRFDAASRFALAGEPALRRDFVNAAFFAWGRKMPEAALEAALALPDAADRDLALHSVFSGWASADPRALAELALGFPDGEEKTAALTKSLRRWMLADPGTAGDWILAHAEAVPIAEAMFRADER